MNRPNLCIVIADGEHARFVAPAPKKAFHTRQSLDSPAAHQKTSDLGTERPPRSMESATGTRHALTPKHDLHELEKEKFARRVAREIDEACARHDFDGFVLVAPVGTLQEIRDALGAGAAAKLAGELRKDLVKVPDHALAPHLGEWALP